MKDNALYLEADEDITSAIDKLKKVTGSSVQIVVPKRSTLLQSVINQKLLKKAASDAGKKLVLVTNDRVATDLAGRVGLAVAPSVGAQAVVVASRATAPVVSDEVIEEDDPTPLAKASSQVDGPTRPSSRLRAAVPALATRQLTDDEPVEAAVAVASVPTASTKDKTSPKVPNFSKLQKRSLWGALVIVAIVGYFVAMHYLTTAKVTLYTNGSRADIDTTFTVDSSAAQTDQAKSVLAGTALTVSHPISTTFTPSGKKDVGTKANGSVTVSNNSGTAQPLSAGTRFVAPDGNVFRSTGDATVPAATASVSANGQVAKQPGSQAIAVTADQPGDGYNEAGGQKYTIPGLSSDQQQLVTASGGQMSGGTSKTVNVVTQGDVDKAHDAAISADHAAALKDLKAKVSSGDELIESSLVVTPANVASNPAVDGQGDQATLTMTINYAAQAVNKAEYTSLVESLEQKQLGANTQVYDNGLASATLTAAAPSGSRQSLHLVTVASGGPKIDTASLINQLKGKKYSDATDLASGLPGVVRADVSLSPAWSTGMPKIAKHITVTIKINKD